MAVFAWAVNANAKSYHPLGGPWELHPPGPRLGNRACGHGRARAHNLCYDKTRPLRDQAVMEFRLRLPTFFLISHQLLGLFSIRSANFALRDQEKA